MKYVLSHKISDEKTCKISKNGQCGERFRVEILFYDDSTRDTYYEYSSIDIME